MLLSKRKKNQNAMNVKKLLISINFLGSVGPIRFVVSEEDLVTTVIKTALKSYAREGRFPVLGKDVTSFALYCQQVVSGALSPLDTVGSYEGARNFLLCKKLETSNGLANDDGATAVTPRRSGSWKTWFNKCLKI